MVTLNPKIEAALRVMEPCRVVHQDGCDIHTLEPEDAAKQPLLTDCKKCHGSGEVPKYSALWNECLGYWWERGHRYLPCLLSVRHEPLQSRDCSCHGTGLVFASTLEGVLASGNALPGEQREVFLNRLVEFDTCDNRRGIKDGLDWWVSLTETERFEAATNSLVAVEKE